MMLIDGCKPHFGIEKRFVRADAAAGAYSKISLAFRPFDLCYIELVIEGTDEGQLYEPNFDSEANCARPHVHLAATVKRNENERLSR